MPRAVDGMKECSICHKVLPVSLYCKSSSRFDGLEYQCKECSRNRKKGYKIRNRDKVLLSQIEYNQTDKARESRRIYAKTNAGKVSIAKTNHKRRHLSKQTTNDLSERDIYFLLHLQKSKCAKCKKDFSLLLPYTLDHIVPATKGGGLTLENVQLLCQVCNSSKSNKSILYRPPLPKLSFEGV